MSHTAGLYFLSHGNSIHTGHPAGLPEAQACSTILKTGQRALVVATYIREKDSLGNF